MSPIFLICALAVVIQPAFSQCTSRAAVAADPRVIGPAIGGFGIPYEMGASALTYDGLAAPFGYDRFTDYAGRGLAYDGLYPAIAPAVDFTPTSGGSLPVTSASAIPPTGITVVSENVFEGPLALAGELPFVGTTAMEGIVPSTGAGAINHACGNGINAMVSENTAFAPEFTAAAIGPVAAPIASAAFAAPGLGYRAGWGGCAL